MRRVRVAASVDMLDHVAYGLHRLYHGVPFVWWFHRAHHGDLDMDATTSTAAARSTTTRHEHIDHCPRQPESFGVNT